MARTELTITVPQSVADIFTFLSVAENHGKFIPNMPEVKQTSAGAMRVGTTMRGVRRDLGFINTEVLYEITEFNEADKKLSMRGKMLFLVFDDGYELSATDGGCKITFWVIFSLEGIMKLATPFLAVIGKIHAYETLYALRKALA